MKKYIFYFLFLISFLNISGLSACEICGSGFGSYFGIMPQYGQHFLGLRYQHQSYLSTPNPLYPSEEIFNQYELWGRFKIHKKIQFLAYIPYASNERFQYGKTTKMQGLGDISLQTNYILLNSGDSIFTQLKQTLTLGAGIKLATGKYKNQEAGSLVNPNFQLGTGSTDYFINLNYTIRYGKFGINTNLRQKFNGLNPENQHRFGHQFMASSQFFWWQNFSKFSILPAIGMDYEHSKQNSFLSDIQEHTGGYASFYNLGTDIYFRYFSVGITHQKPIWQNLTQGEIEAKNRTSVHLTWIF